MESSTGKLIARHSALHQRTGKRIEGGGVSPIPGDLGGVEFGIRRVRLDMR